jgi:hypothetical protein
LPFGPRATNLSTKTPYLKADELPRLKATGS